MAARTIFEFTPDMSLTARHKLIQEIITKTPYLLEFLKKERKLKHVVKLLSLQVSQRLFCFEWPVTVKYNHIDEINAFHLKYSETEELLELETEYWKYKGTQIRIANKLEYEKAQKAKNKAKAKEYLKKRKS